MSHACHAKRHGRGQTVAPAAQELRLPTGRPEMKIRTLKTDGPADKKYYRLFAETFFDFFLRLRVYVETRDRVRGKMQKQFRQFARFSRSKRGRPKMLRLPREIGAVL